MLLQKVHKNSTNGMNGGEKNENPQGTDHKKEEKIVPHKGRITMTYLGKSKQPTYVQLLNGKRNYNVRNMNRLSKVCKTNSISYKIEVIGLF